MRQRNKREAILGLIAVVVIVHACGRSKPNGSAPDSGTVDGRTPDVGAQDDGISDGGTPDRATLDSETLDSETPEGGASDGGISDGKMPDGGTSVGWTELTAADGPEARYRFGMAYDPSRQVVVVFGGYRGLHSGESDDFLNDLWEWSSASAEWTNRKPAGAWPQKREGNAMVYTKDGKVVVFGGYTYTYGFSDIWEWDGQAGVWTERELGGSSSPSGSVGIAYDAGRDRVVLFGALESHTTETWEWDTTAGTWSKRDPPSSPGWRYGTAMAYDSTRGRVVLFGGMLSLTRELADTWEWDGASGTWEERTPMDRPSPRPRGYHAMAFHEGLARIVVFGGEHRVGDAEVHYFDDLWGWDGASWSLLPPGQVTPPLRAEAGMVYDTLRGSLVVFGGTNDPSESHGLGDTWEWRAPSPDAPVEPDAGTSDGGTPDGGTTDGGTPDGGTSVGWTEQTAAYGPDTRCCFGMAYDPSRQVIVVFGGHSIFGLDDLWEWSSASGRWQYRRSHGAWPDAREGHAMAYEGSGKVVVFGGFSYMPPLGDTWEWDGQAGTWIERQPGESPYPSGDAGIAYDAGRGRVVLFGGISPGAVTETWEWDTTAGTWSKRDPPSSPGWRYGMAMAYDSTRGRVSALT